MDYTKEENSHYARIFLKEGDLKNSLGHYAMLYEKEPDNAEAAFFFAYHAFQMFVEEKNYAPVVNTVNSMTENVANAIVHIEGMYCDEDEKIFVISKIVEFYTPIVRFLFANYIPTSSDTTVGCILGLYSLGDAISDKFGSDPTAMTLAATAWKEAVSLQNAYWMNNYKGVRSEDYVEKIKKIEPTYVAPKQAMPLLKKIVDKIKELIKKNN